MTPQAISAPSLYQTLTRRHWYSSGHARHDSLSAAYAQLGLSVGASLDEVKGAYRRLALQCHPDLNKKDGQEFVRITAAYQRIVNKSAVYDSTPSRPRRYPGPVVYAQSPQSRFTPRAAAVWGVGLATGCAFFGAVLLWARAELVQSSYHRRGPSRVVEPTHDALKRERIQALLMEKTRARDGQGWWK
ncbi:hypothetical protein Mapa_015443 [Marchantia paleacea]|nr:hypothetical protein Mapa_015443 [Marchantia paleacea]